MRVLTAMAIAGLVLTGLASAIPELQHDKIHEKRDLRIQTVTTTFYQTVIWVDSHGKVINTEIRAPPHAATTTLRSSTSPKATSSVTGSKPSISGADTTDLNRRPNVAPMPSNEPVTNPQPTALSSPMQSVSSIMNSASPQASSSAASSKTSGNAPVGMGVCYDMIDNNSQCKSQATANSDFGFLKSQGFGIVHIYDIGCPVGNFVTAAAQNGLQLMVGINQITNLQGDLNKLIGMVNGQWNIIHTVYVGNELVNNGVASAGSVAGAVNQARGILQTSGYTGNVVTIDTFNVMQSDPTICSTSDYCATNAHAYFDPNTVAANAGTFVMNAYNAVKANNGGKNVIITETGWPYQGSCNGQACPSKDNQKAAMNSIIKSFSGMPGNVFLFQAYNAGYKQPGPNGVEQFFGIYDTDHFSGGIGTV